ncbi:unnamed protein product [Oikopleura dioica]|uniref:Uncharacterized protein n=1 Tax=Oikopleura dioica TaxID=34765 RepID=E4WTG2_OIKDI|nr:unnamed protein product [Oikopleura dioica]
MFNKIRKFFRRKYNNNEIIVEETGFYEKRKAKSAKASKRSSPNEKKNPFLSAPSSRRGSVRKSIDAAFSQLQIARSMSRSSLREKSRSSNFGRNDFSRQSTASVKMKKSRTVSEDILECPRASKDHQTWRDEQTGKYTMVGVIEGVRKSKSSQDLEGSNKNMWKTQSSTSLSRAKNKQHRN